MRENARKTEGRAEAAFWRSAVWLPAEAAVRRIALRASALQMPLPIGMTVLSMARLGAEVNACGGTPTKRTSAGAICDFPYPDAVLAVNPTDRVGCPIVHTGCEHGPEHR